MLQKRMQMEVSPAEFLATQSSLWMPASVECKLLTHLEGINRNGSYLERSMENLKHHGPTRSMPWSPAPHSHSHGRGNGRQRQH